MYERETRIQNLNRLRERYVDMVKTLTDKDREVQRQTQYNKIQK